MDNSPPPCIIELRGALLEKHEHLLRAWRIVLDMDGDLCCKFAECCEGLSRLDYKGDVVDLFRLYDGQSQLQLRDVDPQLSSQIWEVRNWVKKTFGGPFEMFDAFDESGDGQLSFSEFKEASLKYGLAESDSVIEEIFGGLDLQGDGLISKEEVIVLEADEEERHALYAEEKEKEEEEKNSMMSDLYQQISAFNLKPWHRMSDRPWHTHISSLPQSILEKRRKWERKVAQRKYEALELFRHHLKVTYGHELRAWRRELDPDNTYVLTRSRLTQYCAKVCFKANPAVLWSALNSDADAVITIEEWVPKHAKVLANFRAWVHKRQLQCSKLPGLGGHGKKVSATSKEFADSLLNLGYGAYHGTTFQEELDVLISSLDFNGCGFVRTEDLAWLDEWRPPAWLVSSPDAQAMHNLRQLFINRFGNLIQAWRRVLDIDRSNRVSWNEFKAAAETIRFTGNVAGAWRVLDVDFSGYISLREFDFGGYEHLASFKHWADLNFGSVIRAFHFLDKDRSGGLTFAEVRKACQRLGWTGNPRALFELLDTGHASGEPSRYITLNEIDFLDSLVDLHFPHPIKKETKGTVCHSSTAFDCTRTAAELDVMLELCREETDADVLFRHPRRKSRPRSASSIGSRDPFRQSKIHSTNSVGSTCRHPQRQQLRQQTPGLRECRAMQLSRSASTPELHVRESISCHFGHRLNTVKPKERV